MKEVTLLTLIGTRTGEVLHGGWDSVLWQSPKLDQRSTSIDDVVRLTSFGQIDLGRPSGAIWLL